MGSTGGRGTIAVMHAQYARYAAFYDASGQARFSFLMAHYLDEVLARHAPAAALPRTWLDLACGTGTLAMLLAGRDWQVTGVDRAPAMLAQARARMRGLLAVGMVRLCAGDIRALPAAVTQQPYAVVTCVFDSLNHLLTEDDLRACFAQVAQVLPPGGVFIGDMNTQHFLAHIWDACEVTEQDGYIEVGVSQHDPASDTIAMHLIGFVGDDATGYERFDEHHRERAYPLATVSELLQQVGLQVEAVYTCFTFDAADDAAWRALWVARQPGGQQHGSE